MRGRVLCAWLLLELGAYAWASGPSEVIFPPQRLPLTFSHQKHLAKQIACDFCHEKAPGSRLSSDSLIPDEEVCATCHPIDREGKGQPKATPCATCHPR